MSRAPFLCSLRRNKKMRETMWSVQLEANSWNDDYYNGTYDECVNYCKKYKHTIDGQECRLAKILIEDGLAIEVLEIVDEL